MWIILESSKIVLCFKKAKFIILLEINNEWRSVANP